MIRASLEWGYGPNSGESGWIPAGQPNFDPSWSGLGAAHDLVEHMRPHRTGGTVADELQALGGMLYGRGLSGMFSQDPGDLLANEWEYHSIDAWCELNQPPRTVKRLRGNEGERIEDWLETARRKTLKHLLRDLNPSAGWTLDERRRVREVLDWMVVWTRIGVQRFKRRFHGLGPGQIASVFMNVQQAIDPLLKEEGNEGDYIAVAINPKTRECDARLRRLYDY